MNWATDALRRWSRFITCFSMLDWVDKGQNLVTSYMLFLMTQLYIYYWQKFET